MGKKGTDQLINELQADDAKVRRRAAQTLCRRRDRAAAEALVCALDDKDRRVRDASAAAIAEMKPAIEGAEEILLEAHRKKKFKNIVWLLRKVDACTAEAAQLFLRGLHSKDAQVRIESVLGLGGATSSKDIPFDKIAHALMECLDDTDGYVVDAAARALGKLGEHAECAIDKLKEAHDAKRPISGSLVIDSWSVQNLPEPVDEKTAENIIISTGEAILSIRPPAASTVLPRICQILRDRKSNHDSRKRSARVLGLLEAPGNEVVSSLIAAAIGVDELVAEEATISLGRLGEHAEEATPSLIALLDENSVVGDEQKRCMERHLEVLAANSALGTISPEPRLLELRREAAKALGSICSELEPAVPGLLGYIDDSELKNPARKAIIGIVTRALNTDDFRAALDQLDAQGNELAGMLRGIEE